MSVTPFAALGSGDAKSTLAFRSQAIRFGLWLGWLSIAVVAGGLALGARSARPALIALTLAAALCNGLAGLVPWKRWLQRPVGQLLVDVWSGLLIAFIALLVTRGGPNFGLLLFVALPFIAVVQTGRRRSFWLAARAVSCMTVAVAVRLPLGATAMRLGLVGAVVAATLALVGALRCQAAANERAREADHRIKNSLQVAADLLLLGRPDGDAAASFDDAAARLRSIATVHRLLTVSAEALDARMLLGDIAAAAPGVVTVDAAPILLDGSTAQKVGIVANELITNAVRHGAPPVHVRLRPRRDGRQARLRVDDAGESRPAAAAAALGLRLVRQTVERGLCGSFELGRSPLGGTRAEVTFPLARCGS